MQRTTLYLARAVVLATAALALGGCAARAKVITAITNNSNQMKFLYVQGDAQGIIKCGVAADGALSNCRDMAVVLEE